MRCFTNADGDEQRYKTWKTQVSLAFCKTIFVVEYTLTIYTVCAVVVSTAIRHSTRCGARRPAQLVLCRIAVPTTHAQTVSWSIPITIIGSDNGLWSGRHQAIIWTNAGILLIGPF